MAVVDTEATVGVAAAVHGGITMTQPFKGKPPRLSEVFQRDIPPVYFIKFCTLHRQPVLANDPVHDAFRSYAEAGAAKANVAVGRYVIMPDHVHLFVQGGDNFNLGLWIRGLKRAMASGVTPSSGVGAAVPGGKAQPTQKTGATPPSAPPKLWQPGFFDHLLRNSESYQQKWHYVRENPVRAGLVARAEDWPYQGEIAPIDRV